MIQLIFIEKRPVAGRVIEITAGATIGRDGCDVVLPDPEASRRHAIMHEIHGDPALEDLGSRNGTFVNESRIEGIVQLNEGDEVRFGNSVWRLSTPEAAESSR